MTATARIAFAAAVLTLAACNQAEAPAAAAPAADASATPAAATAAQAAGALVIDSEGLRLVSDSGSASPIPFNTAQAQVIQAVAASVGEAAPQVTTNGECGEGPMQFAQFANGLQLGFQDGKFTGWTVDKAGLTTMDGIGVGSTRASMEETSEIELVPDSTLGVEFTSGDMSGILSAAGPTGKVETLWAGMACVFR